MNLEVLVSKMNASDAMTCRTHLSVRTNLDRKLEESQLNRANRQQSYDEVHAIRY